ncbi:iron uptake transporter permease EfeU [Pantoea sp. App145]|uniref:iron uptake transporter permease EfeU n=1 Tax=Pantoea sp. App145 TaxID=3071567 RepID=UPI003A80D206
MLATFIIALREGLEAALIVGIIAAFLRKNGKPLTAMWVGVVCAVILSLAVGFVLNLTENALPQARQEMMESIIGLVAVFFVTGMVMWMNSHAHNLKRQLETEAAEAITRSSAMALASMAFLSVLKEGFETSVFLLATFSASQSAIWAAVGAVLGLLVAILVGWGIYAGGIRINLSRFFRFTGLFLILVAAGLIISALRSAHEAGWLNAGQQRVADLTWLVTPGTIQSALITGVLGIPADPRLVEFAGWLIYIVAVAALIYWPAHLRPAPKRAAQFTAVTGAGLALTALLLFLVYPAPNADIPDEIPLVSRTSQQTVGHISSQPATGKPQFAVTLEGLPAAALTVPDDQLSKVTTSGKQEWQADYSYEPADASSPLTLDQVMEAYGNRIPVGLSPAQHPGPYQAKWTVNCSVDATMLRGVVVTAESHSSTYITLSGSGLQSPRTISARARNAEAGCDWQISPAFSQDIEQRLRDAVAAQDVYHFWAVILPSLFAILAFTCFFSASRQFRRLKGDRARGRSKQGLLDSSTHQ